MKIFDNLHAFLWNSTTANNCNTYFVDGQTRIIIDPGHVRLLGHVETGLAELQLGIEDMGLVIVTHLHPDHIESVPLFKDAGALATIHETDWELAKKMGDHVKSYLGRDIADFKPDFLLTEGEFSVGEIEFTVFHTPGHSPGSASIYWPDKKALFTGDLIFNGGIGRTDLPGGNGAQLIDSIKRLSELDVDWLLPGHGDIVSGAEEVRANFEHIEQFWFRRV